MIMMTIFITISLRMLKNSSMSRARSPILPMQMPKAMKKPIRPARNTVQLHTNTGHRRADVEVLSRLGFLTAVCVQ